jgi:hypothetical protein
MSCPRCNNTVAPSAEVQRCSRCGGRFTLHAGALLDPTVIPPAVDPALPTIKVKAPGILLTQCAVTPEGVTQGLLDPVTGMIPLDQAGIAFADILTVTTWRSVDVLGLVVALVIPVPIALVCLVSAVTSTPWALIGGLPFTLGAALMIHGAVGRQRNFVRVAGGARMITSRFDRPARRRARFHAELLRRAGISPTPIP